MDLKNKTALVVGGGSGIGLGIAVALAEEGCRVAVADCNAEGLARAAAAYSGRPAIITQPCNVTVRGDCAALAAWAGQQLGRLDIVVNTAGINVARRKMCDLDPADFDRIMAVNCTGFFNLLQAVLPGLRKQGDGLIVNISSVAGKRALALAGPAYCASKFGVAGLATAVGLESAPTESASPTSIPAT